MASSRFRRPRYLIPVVAFVVLAAVGAGVYTTKRAPAPAALAFSEFLQQVESGGVAQVTFGDRVINVVLRNGREAQTIPPPEFLAANSNFVTDLVHRQIRVDVAPTADPASLSWGAMLMASAFLGLLGFTVYRTTAGRIPSITGRARVAERGESVVTFQDVAGVDEAKDEVKEIVDFLREPDRFSAIGGRIPKGVLLVGPPGTGKTLLARSIAGEAGVPFLFASGSDFVEMYAGVGASRVRRLFRDARRHSSCIVFIDELDAVGRSRGGNSLSHEEREQTLNQLLVEMDGFEGHQGIVVIAATNRQDILDPALLRPGRFDRQVTVGNPDLKGREAILKVHARKIAVDADVNLRSIARGTPGFSGADLANLVNEAALFAARVGRTTVTDADLQEARDKVLMGVERRSIALTELDRVNCAYHEAGHAVVAALLPGADPLHKVTIIPRGRAMGVTMQLPEADRHTYTKGYLETQVAVLMGGRVAEELFMNHMTSGASNDIERATDIAQHMVCEWGMSQLGPLAFRKPGNAYDPDRPHNVSEATAQRVDEEIRRVVMTGYDRARQVIEQNIASVRMLAEDLLQNESLEADEIKALLTRAGARMETGEAVGV
ncbi:MAG TPA: ATP-dependent zinc metalloprotease FtsH [Vicinamibacterales bacterium]|nr:ATP-dependent zinc metalloprotease FtsH [Vicinamibacterales bacterium]